MNWIQHMNRCTGPAPCTCPITQVHQPANALCPRNAERKAKLAQLRREIQADAFIDRDGVRVDADQTKPLSGTEGGGQ
jgi:hypothetical protein